MNSSVPNPNLAFSTITKKSPLVTQNPNVAQSQTATKFKDLIASRDIEYTTIADPQLKTSVNTDTLRQSLVISNQANVDFALFKKSKKTGKTLQRTAKLAQSDILHFLQDKNRKLYSTPSQLTPETYTEYQQRMSASTAAQKKLILPWAPKTAGTADYRISFVRRPVAGAEAKVDSAFYFNTKNDFEKAKNYLKFIELLEAKKTGTPPHVLLNNLNQAFKGQLAAKFRKLMGVRAGQARAENLIRKETLIRNTNLLLTSNANLTSTLTSRWLRFARDRDSLKKDQDRAVRDRIENLSNTIKRSSLILTLNSYLVGAMLEAWKNEAEARIQSYKEDIALFLDCIEVSSSIIQPSLKVEVTISKDYPESLVINNTRIRDKALERQLDFRLNCRVKGPKTAQVYYWNIVQSELLPAERSGQNANAQEGPFALRFNEYILDHLDLIELRFLLSDESEVVRAYQYVSLKSLYAASKSGNNIWLSLNTSHKGNLNAPLLHIKAFSNRIDHSNENVFDVETAGISNLESIHDAFYNYRFNMPAITPKHDKILELLPASWNVIDEKTKSLKRSDQFGPFINTVKAKLAKHYYETTSRQLARLRKSAQIWARLQDELTSYIPKENRNNASQLYVDERYIKNLAGLQKPVIEEGGADDGASQEFQDEYNGIVSYLFKRDKWESKDEWYSFYQKLGALCKKGLPPQHRLNIWSEMSRVVYFVNLTENEHKKQRGVKYYQQAYLNQDMNDRSRTVDNIYKKSKIVYEQLKKDAEKEFIYLYQELEDDLEFLRDQFESSDKQKISYERNLRSICRTFIFWSKLFSDPSTEEKIRYFVTYSRAILILCHGLITCQTCSYMEQEATVEEEQVFWNLISLATYIVSSYFETNEDTVSVDKLTFKEGDNLERKKNKITNSALRCNQIKGIKGDLLILKILLKEYEPEIYSKFEELGLPLEFYFADHMLTLFFNLFNPGLTFRIWDVLFFEGSSANQVRCNRMIVCFLFVLLRDCKAMLLKAKKASDINFIIETYAKFQTKYGAFIKQAYEVSKNYFEQALPRDQTFLEKLSYIKYALFASDYNKLDKKIRSIEQSIEGNYFTYTLQQNMALFALTNSKYQYRPEADLETLSYTVLARMIKDFQGEFGVKTTEAKTKEADYMIDDPNQKRYKLFQDVNIDTRKFLKGRMSTLHFRIHSLVTYWPNLEDLSVVVVYGKDRQKKKDLQSFNVEFEGVFSLNNSREIPRYLNLEIVDEKDAMNPQKIKYLSIDLKRVAFEVPTKLNLKFREENPNIYNNNHITSEVELTLLLEGSEGAHDVKVDYGLFFTVPELENPVYDTFRDKDFSQTVTAGHNDEGEIERPTYHGGASFLRDRHAWKENFAVDYEEFLKIMKQIAPFWINNADLSKIYETIAKANRNNTFYITDFFVLLVLFGKFTSIQKFGLLFDLFTGFDDTFTDKTREVPYHILKGLTAYIFDLFMIYMPYNELENIVDLSIYGEIPNIKKVTVNGQVTPKNEIIKQHLNRLSNFMHASYNTKELHLYQAPVLDILRSVYEKEIERTFKQPINRIEITYVTNGMSHKLRFDIDENWKIVEDPADGRKSTKSGARVLANYRNVIALQNTPKIFGRNEFIKVMQKLPMINYLCSLEHTEISNTLTYLNNIKFTINMDGESVYTIAPTHEPIVKPVLTNAEDLLRYKKKDFKTVLREWDDIVRVTGYKAGSNSNLRSSRSNFRGNKMKPSSEVQKIPSSKLNLFFSHNQLVSYAKRSIIKSISEAVQRSSGTVDQFNPLLFNRNLWELDYTVTLNVNKNRDFDITDKKKSPFKTLVELMERTTNIEIEEIEIVYNIKNTTIPETFIEPYSQLSLYRYAEGSTEWLPCKIKYKFEYVKRDEGSYYNREAAIDGFGVVFERFPDETVLKKSSEVAVIKMIDFEELELKQVDPLTSKAVTVDRAAAGFSPQRNQQQGGGPKVLFQKPSDDDDNLFGSGSNPQGSAYGGQKVRSGLPGLYDGVPRDAREDEEDQFGGRLKVTH